MNCDKFRPRESYPLHIRIHMTIKCSCAIKAQSFVFFDGRKLKNNKIFVKIITILRNLDDISSKRFTWYAFYMEIKSKKKKSQIFNFLSQKSSSHYYAI